MNKHFYLILISLCFLNLSLQEIARSSTRDFVTAYFQTIRGKDYILDRDCLSGKFDDMVKELIAEFKERNWIMFAVTLHSIISLELKNCPVEDFEGIIKDLRISMKNGTSLANTLKNFSCIKEEFKEYLNSEESSAALGHLIGKLTKIVVYGDIREIEHQENNMIFLG